MQKIKVTARAKREFEFLISSNLDLIGESSSHPSSADGYSALECWFSKDTYGQTLPCREIDQLQKAERCKASWNLQISLWAEDIADGMLMRREELQTYCDGLPQWIFAATMHQAAKLCRKRVGFVPTFAQNATAQHTPSG